MIRFASILALCTAWIIPGQAVARSIATTIEPSHGPVEITGCRAAYNALTGLVVWLDFKNAGTKTATAVRFFFRATDAFGQPLQSRSGDRLGTFSPGVVIQNWQGSNAGVIAATGPTVANVVCRVEMVRFADGKHMER